VLPRLDRDPPKFEKTALEIGNDFSANEPESVFDELARGEERRRVVIGVVGEPRDDRRPIDAGVRSRINRRLSPNHLRFESIGDLPQFAALVVVRPIWAQVLSAFENQTNPTGKRRNLASYRLALHRLSNLAHIRNVCHGFEI
jgi:hypothetical protein